MGNEKTSNIKKGDQQCENIKEPISKFREEINKHLDHLEKKLYKEAVTVWGQEKSKLTDFVSEIEEKRRNFRKCRMIYQPLQKILQNCNPFRGLKNKEIRIIDFKGNTVNSIQVQNEFNLNHLVYCDNRVIYNDYGGKVVTCVDGSGKHIWQYKQDLKGPQGLCVDTYGNIIVTDRTSSRIIAISKDGQDSKVLVRKKDGLNYPIDICLRNNESYGFVCYESGKYLAKFNLSYD
ncbi:unnamed protein product [Mytilus edulis]|uniref:Tripartite motif-containing protein 2 n=1 Tax=Mytilus edulis TaxID=6550 RepID=A0A8S3Q4L2_MYTED|nr:unnamed protein product [Mytilus edulis]